MRTTAAQLISGINELFSHCHHCSANTNLRAQVIHACAAFADEWVDHNVKMNNEDCMHRFDCEPFRVGMCATVKCQRRKFWKEKG